MCKICDDKHAIWECEKFKSMAVSKRWEQAKFHHLFYCCLETNEKNEETILLTKFSRKDQSQDVAMRTLPVVLTNGKLLIKVNALLDDASTQTYINRDVAAELGLQGLMKEITISVLNGRVNTFQTMPVEFQLQSIGGKLKKKINALTVDRVKSNILGQQPIVDILIGLDNAELHSSKTEIKVRTGNLIAQLTPLGWTCVGALGRTQIHSYEFGGTSSSFVSSKTRVAPLNSVSIPRLELMNAVLGLKLALSVIEALPCTIKMENVIFWSDSLNTLSWIKNPSRKFETFVANRVGGIQSHSKNLWWTGPDFIQQEESQWPTKEFKEIEYKLILEVKNMAIKSEKNSDSWRLEPIRHPSWRRLTQILAWVRRFQHNCFKKCLSSVTLSTEEVNDAEIELIINAQKRTYAQSVDK
ncbi:uncharacterized protein LOC124814782 [Hydra vulgaris]|uniref:uncharacterized protein LOC124814782 n=1 Tax=Hydra vulgaris TaxID=6087 RepID=UPI001F5E9D4F|nr:uncharacterized protein LOC124814782 [Hydra vulgaris]